MNWAERTQAPLMILSTFSAHQMRFTVRARRNPHQAAASQAQTCLCSSGCSCRRKPARTGIWLVGRTGRTGQEGCLSPVRTAFCCPVSPRDAWWMKMGRGGDFGPRSFLLLHLPVTSTVRQRAAKHRALGCDSSPVLDRIQEHRRRHMR